MAKEEYQPAIYAKALKYRNDHSYRKNIDFFVLSFIFFFFSVKSFVELYLKII
jgi:hypothetical protein